MRTFLIRSAALVLAGSAVLAGCGGDGEKNVDADRLYFDIGCFRAPFYRGADIDQISPLAQCIRGFISEGMNTRLLPCVDEHDLKREVQELANCISEFPIVTPTPG